MIPLRHALAQGPMIRALGGVALAALVPRRTSSAAPAEAPGPWVEAELPPRPEALVRDYVARVGGDPAWYRGRLPVHLFPQWGFAIALRAIAGLPYPYARAVNAGCRIDVRAPLPAGEPLRVRARVEAVDDDGRRALITLRVVTGTRNEPEAMTADLWVHLPLTMGGPRPPHTRVTMGGPRPPQTPRSPGEAALQTPRSTGEGAPREKRRPAVPAGAVEVARLSLDRRAGLDFALLTGDFNPIHWVPAYARAVGFRSTILHGFGTLAWAIEALNGGPFAGDPARLGAIEARFTKPLVLPAQVSVYTGPGPSVWVGEQPGADAYLEGSLIVQ